MSACDVVGGQHLGFVLDPSQCRYDPTKDAAVLCTGVRATASSAPARRGVREPGRGRRINKIWYGQTADGSVPDPALDNASTSNLAEQPAVVGPDARPDLRLAGNPARRRSGPFPIATDMVALELQDPTYATPASSTPPATAPTSGRRTDVWPTSRTRTPGRRAAAVLRQHQHRQRRPERRAMPA